MMRPISRETDRASWVALVAPSIAAVTPADRSLSRSSFRFCRARPALLELRQQRLAVGTAGRSSDDALPLEQRQPALRGPASRASFFRFSMR